MLREEADPKGFGYIKVRDEDPRDRAVLVGVHKTKKAVLEAKREQRDKVKSSRSMLVAGGTGPRPAGPQKWLILSATRSRAPRSGGILDPG